MVRAPDSVLIAPARACDGCSALRRETRETGRVLDESNGHGIGRGIAVPMPHGVTTGGSGAPFARCWARLRMVLTRR